MRLRRRGARQSNDKLPWVPGIYFAFDTQPEKIVVQNSSSIRGNKRDAPLHLPQHRWF